MSVFTISTSELRPTGAATIVGARWAVASVSVGAPSSALIVVVASRAERASYSTAEPSLLPRP